MSSNLELNVTYRLVENKLTCHIKVKNTDHQPIYFQVGGHPAFACPTHGSKAINPPTCFAAQSPT